MFTSKRLFIASVFVSILFGRESCVVAQSRLHDAELNAWTRFGVGSWKQMRSLTETLDETGKVLSSSVRETKTTLIEVADAHYTLLLETTMEVAGRKLSVSAKNLQQGYNGESNGQIAEVTVVGPGDVTIDGRKYPSEIRQVVINGDELKRVSQLHVCETVSPYYLRRETKTVDAAGSMKGYDSLVELVTIDMPCQVLAESKRVAYVKTTHRQGNGATTVVLETHCDDVPGGVIAHCSKETNAAGRTVSRETLELLEYQVVTIAAESLTIGKSTTARRRIFQRNGRKRSG